MNSPVSLETAILLKAKGFKGLCFYYYDQSEELQEAYKDWPEESESGGTLFLTDLLESHNSYSSFDISAPTITNVIDWLYKEHNLYIEMILSNIAPYSTFRYRVLEIGKYSTLPYTDTHSNNLSKAYSLAIDYILQTQNLINK
jgi:hypothetical protein